MWTHIQKSPLNLCAKGEIKQKSQQFNLFKENELFPLETGNVSPY